MLIRSVPSRYGGQFGVGESVSPVTIASYLEYMDKLHTASETQVEDAHNSLPESTAQHRDSRDHGLVAPQYIFKTVEKLRDVPTPKHTYDEGAGPETEMLTPALFEPGALGHNARHVSQDPFLLPRAKAEFPSYFPRSLAWKLPCPIVKFLH